MCFLTRGDHAPAPVCAGCQRFDNDHRPLQRCRRSGIGRGRGARQPVRRTRGGPSTATPIKHLVVIFQRERLVRPLFRDLSERRQPARRAAFHAAPRHAAVNNLANANLLTNNPNFTNPANGTGAAEPFRLDRTQANTADQNHAYTRRAAGRRRRQGRPVPEIHRQRHAGRRRRVRHQGSGDGLLRRQHRHRAVALRAALRA